MQRTLGTRGLKVRWLVAMAWVNVLITYVVNMRLVLDYEDSGLVT
jgi:hypothetical protein